MVMYVGGNGSSCEIRNEATDETFVDPGVRSVVLNGAASDTSFVKSET